MRSLIKQIEARLRATPQLTGWAVRKYTDSQERKSTPAIEIGFAQAQAQDSDTCPVELSPIYSIRLIHRTSDDSDELLDAALQTVISRLHNWLPGQVQGKYWGRIALEGVRDDPYPDGGHDSYIITFSSSTTYHGCAFTDR